MTIPTSIRNDQTSFKRQALVYVDPREATKTLTLAIEKCNSPLAQMILAHTLASHALDTGHRSSMTRAIREVEASRCFIGDTSLMLTARAKRYLGFVEDPDGPYWIPAVRQSHDGE